MHIYIEPSFTRLCLQREMSLDRIWPQLIAVLWPCRRYALVATQHGGHSCDLIKYWLYIELERVKEREPLLVEQLTKRCIY